MHLIKFFLLHYPVRKNSFLFESHDDFSEGTFIYYQHIANDLGLKKLYWYCDTKNINKAKALVGRHFILHDRYGFFREVRRFFFEYTTQYYVYSHRYFWKHNIKKKQVVLFLDHGTSFDYNCLPGYYDVMPYKCINIVPSEQGKREAMKILKNYKTIVCMNPRLLPLIDNKYKKDNSLYYQKMKINNDCKIIYWLPTWMPNHYNEGNVVDYHQISSTVDSNSLKKLNSFLSKNNIVLVIKLHPMYKSINISNGLSYSNVIISINNDILNANTDLYSLLNESFMLITDTSSVFLDYYLTSKPIIFVKQDDDNGKILPDKEYQKYMAGPMVDNVDSIISSIESFLENDIYINDRIKQCKIWNVRMNDVELFNTLDVSLGVKNG